MITMSPNYELMEYDVFYKHDYIGSYSVSEGLQISPKRLEGWLDENFFTSMIDAIEGVSNKCMN